ncbi:MAG: cupredoxin domain-containing protein [Candidatus Aenigmarchaeota archaeon]|nr:cupredoxin domain-containing protein [Candidatus Aenigmarchaeota archaeon]
MTMFSRETELGIGIVIVVLVIAAFLTGGTPVSTGNTSPESPYQQTGSTNQPSEILPGAATITVSDAGFAPSSVSLAAGEVEITVTNAAQRTHGFTLAAYGIDQIVPAGASRTFKFTATTGTYTFADTIDPSKTGTLRVT